MRSENDWDDQGRAARQADEDALVHREPNRVAYDERERRQWWRQVCSNRPQTGSDSVRTGYIAPGSPVPGATPGDKGKGAEGKCKGGKTQGKRSRADYEEGGSSSSSQSSWSWSNPGSSSWWNPGAWAAWCNW